ncbi:MAG: saccharopine dehydrogenase NADP-binding domain-containing protein [Gemmatimonadota bacterium]|nr:MAG: saccharopine dehydrogenase NADP-binding domain-containing protein [Gemmatimonadota bacterium]
MVKTAVLGAGRVGAAIVADLAADRDFDVTAVDISQPALALAKASGASRTVRADLADTVAVSELASEHDLIVGAVPGPIGFQTLEAVVRAGRHYVDISFFNEDPFEVDSLAHENGVVALVDCGVAPGLSNLILGHHAATSDRVDRFACFVGGLPAERDSLFQYKATFSPIDVIAEYTRPARYIQGGELREVPALSEVEVIDFPGVGTVEAFLTDGLRTLLDTIHVPDMKEKTVRYPGHAEQMRLLREMGLFDSEAVEVGGVHVSPLELTAKLLFPLWRFEPGEPDLTVMRVEVDALTGDTNQSYRYDLLDRYDPTTDTASMARTTGYTCTALTRLVARGLYTQPGVSPPELVGREVGCFDFVIADLKARGVSLTVSSV